VKPLITNFEKSNAYRARIHDLIPGGAHTYSKGDDQFPVLSPAAIVSGRGVRVRDLDGNEYLDCSMGLTSVSLGHAYPSVVERVKAELDNGANFQRPSVLELQTAETFLSLLPQHQMIKFAKNGSTVTTAAVKLARAKTGRKLVAFPGDHPFYSYDDWFVGSTPSNRGVPEDVARLSVTYRGCDLSSLQVLFERHPGQIACVISEPERGTCQAGCPCGGDPAEVIRRSIAMAHAHGAVFIVDEMITGFKTAFPGAITKYGLAPDMATWGKGIANGFAFCALTGTSEVMELGGIRATGQEKVFLISTTHGAETHAMAAALATIEQFRSSDVVGHNHAIGRLLVTQCQGVVADRGLDRYLEVVSCDWMPLFVFRDRDGKVCQGMRTLFMQEMIKRGVLFQGAFVPCYSHTESDVADFVGAFGNSLPVYADALERGYHALLVGEPAKPVFRKHL